MAHDLVTLVDALRVPLVHGVEWSDLGARLRAACDTLVAAGALPPERVGPVRAWRQRLAGYEKLPRGDQEVERARGLRICRTLVGDARPVPPLPPAPVAREGPLGASVLTLPGIGPALAQRLAERRLTSIEDLAWLVPRRYDDLRTVVPLAEVLAGGAPIGQRATFRATVKKVRAGSYRRRFLFVQLVDGDAELGASWFNVHGGMARRFVAGEQVILSGVIREHKGLPAIANPELLGTPDEDGASAKATIVARYPEVEGVAPAILRRVCREAAVRAGPHLADGLPRAIADGLALPSLATSLAALHAPPPALDDDATRALLAGESPWHRRLAFDELFFLALAIARRRARRQAAIAPACPPRGDAAAEVARVFPFALTAAQRRAIATITADLAGERPMNRLLQGDVGSGKTAVAFAAAHAAMAAGRQVAIMAPTELLAEQHMSTLGPWAAAVGRRAALLTASTPRGVRESTLGMVASGAASLLVGTHALLADRVDFADLGLVIIDEQHRFGVAQRVRLRVGAPDSREHLPHLLVMTATPIPRSLALTIYGDLDVTTLDELPPGRSPPRTRVLSGTRGRAGAYGLLARQLASGARGFVVCPLVAPSEDADWVDATTTAQRLAAELAPRRVGLVHGRMAPAERDAAMARLRSGELDVLVATTVIEVGVDVPAATVMIVEDADRFGLAQLHQLRGRVGRGGGEAHCVLLTRGTRTSDATRRLEIMEATTDGFRIAEEDLAIRGPGEILGVKQAGLPKLRFADIVRHAPLAAEARRAAERLLDEDPALERHAATAAVLAARLSDGAVTSEGG